MDPGSAVEETPGGTWATGATTVIQVDLSGFVTYNCIKSESRIWTTCLSGNHRSVEVEI